MTLPITEALAQYLDKVGYSMESLADRAGGGVTIWYRIRRTRKGWLTDATVAMLAHGLGITEDELLRITLGVPAEARGHPCEGKPPELADLCHAWPDLDESTRAMVLAMARAALEKRGSAAGTGKSQTA